MKTLHTILREDFGLLDRSEIKSDLLGITGIRGVYDEPIRNGLVVEYDAGILDHAKLTEIMCRVGVIPDSHNPNIGRGIGDG